MWWWWWFENYVNIDPYDWIIIRIWLMLLVPFYSNIASVGWRSHYMVYSRSSFLLKITTNVQRFFVQRKQNWIKIRFYFENWKQMVSFVRFDCQMFLFSALHVHVGAFIMQRGYLKQCSFIDFPITRCLSEISSRYVDFDICHLLGLICGVSGWMAYTARSSAAFF